MRRKVLFLLLVFLILIASCYVVNAANPSSIKYDGFTYDLSSLELYSQTFAFYNSRENKVVVATAPDSTVITAIEDYYTFANGDYKIYFFNKGVNEVYEIITPSNNNTFRGNRTQNMIYSNFDILKGDKTVWFKATDKSNEFELNLSVDKIDYTTDLPVTISCQSLSAAEIAKYKLYYSIGDTNDFKSCEVRSFTDNGVTTHQWYLEVYRNDTYHFKFVNEETNEEIYESIKISNIIVTQDNVNNYIDGVFRPSPYLSYEYISDTEINILTQKFTLEEISKLKCFYAKDITEFDNEDLWSKLDLKSYRDTLKNRTLYQFYLNVKNDNGSGDGTYHFRFFNKETEEYTYSTFKLNFSDIVEYHRQDEQNKTSKSILDIMKDFFSWIFNFFGSLLDFFVHIFVPTDEQWADLDTQDLAFKGQIEGKFPFFYWFQEELEKADEYVYSDDFLKIDFPSWKMDLGIIKYQTPDISFTAVRDAYAPYRLTIRNSLFIIAVGLAIVYIIKYILNYSVTGSASLIFGNSANVSSSDSWKIDGQTSLFGRDKK